MGECWLQEHAYTAGAGETRFLEKKVHFEKRVDVGPHVLLDKERCIQCTRCIRFCDEVTGTSELALVARGNHTEVDIFPGRPLDNAYSGNVVDICPVGRPDAEGISLQVPPVVSQNSGFGVPRLRPWLQHQSLASGSGHLPASRPGTTMM